MTEKIGGIKYKKRGSKYPNYYKPTFDTPECSYQGKKRGRKTNIERQEIRNIPKLVKTTGNFVIDFD